jgi:uncharacterized coiled-coil DUF342 family protein
MEKLNKISEIMEKKSEIVNAAYELRSKIDLLNQELDTFSDGFYYILLFKKQGEHRTLTSKANCIEVAEYNIEVLWENSQYYDFQIWTDNPNFNNIKAKVIKVDESSKSDFMDIISLLDFSVKIHF